MKLLYVHSAVECPLLPENRLRPTTECFHCEYFMGYDNAVVNFQIVCAHRRSAPARRIKLQRTSKPSAAEAQQ